MLEQKFNRDWKFWVEEDSFALVWNIPKTAIAVTLPHDAMFSKAAHAKSLNGGNTGFRDGEIYTYVKMLQAPENYRNKTVMLKFEGIYMNAFVYVNGQLAGKNPFGYSTFYVPLNDFLKYGAENEIRIQVRNGAMTNSRWYSGGGIYRDVYLLVADLVYLTAAGVQLKTASADQDAAVIKISSELKNRQALPCEVRLEQTIIDANGKAVAADEVPVILMAGEQRKIPRQLMVAKPRLWSDREPYLYTCVSKLYQGTDLLDESRESFGIRTLEVDVKRGLRINQKSVKLRGACIHHDSGLLGAATYSEAQYRQIKLLKEAGFNAVRMAHHPIAPAMLRACDELGMYVMDEAFDMWNRSKSDYDYGLYFQEWWEQDVTAMVRKDYNHPSVILYSLGNEIPEIGTPHGARLCHELVTRTKALDDTRYTLASINGVFAAGDAVGEIMQDILSALPQAQETQGNVNNFLTMMDKHLDKIVVHPAISKRLELACASTDISGYNYMTARYQPDGQAYPNRIIVGSETYPPEIARNWELVEKLPYVIGDFTWTGWDYIGEAGVGVPAYQWGEGGFGAGFPCQLAYCGDLDITGFRRPASYYREVVFGLRKQPYLAVQDPNRYGQDLIKTPWVISDALSCWSWSGCEGKPVIVEVYAGGAETELFLNDVSCGRKPAGTAAGYRVLFETTYEKGTLKAVNYDETGKVIGATEIKTANATRVLKMSIEKPVKEQELIYIPIEICDEAGTNCCESREVTVMVSGAAELAGFGSGNPQPAAGDDERTTATWHGRALLILKPDETGGKILVEATAEGIAAEAKLEILKQPEKVG